MGYLSKSRLKKLTCAYIVVEIACGVDSSCLFMRWHILTNVLPLLEFEYNINLYQFETSVHQDRFYLLVPLMSGRFL